MARKTAKVALADLSAKVGGKLPPILTGCPSWAPPGHGCRVECVQEIHAPGRRRATRQDKEAFLAEQAREHAEQAAAGARARAARPAPPPAPTEPISRHERSEDSHAYVERAIRESQLPPLPADTPYELYQPDGEDKGVIPVWRPLRRADW